MGKGRSPLQEEPRMENFMAGKEILQYWKAGKLRAPLEYTCFKEKIMVFSKGERKDWTE